MIWFVLLVALSFNYLHQVAPQSTSSSSLPADIHRTIGLAGGQSQWAQIDSDAQEDADDGDQDDEDDGKSKY